MAYYWQQLVLMEKKLEYSEGEKKEIEKYFNEINKINEYSKIVPQELIDNLLN